VFNIIVFGWWGLLIWGIQMIWIPFWAAGVINGVGHWIGYRNGKTKDHSRNIMPWGIVIGGECLHNNHHLDPANPRLSRKWWEFDIGWMYITVLKSLGLATLPTRQPQ
jgi:stearoyl-CoA desaturase (delta-9 desaturase)